MTWCMKLAKNAAKIEEKTKKRATRDAEVKLEAPSHEKAALKRVKTIREGLANLE